MVPEVSGELFSTVGAGGVAIHSQALRYLLGA